MARFLIDENLPRRFTLWTSDDFVFVHDIGPTWDDARVWDYALLHSLCIVTNDMDFYHRAMSVEVGPRIIQLRLFNMRMREWHAVLTKAWPKIVLAVERCRIIVVYRDRLDIITS